MKKIVVLALLISSFSFAQDKIKVARNIEQKRTMSLGFSNSEPSAFELTGEKKHLKTDFFGYNHSSVLKLGYGSTVVNLSGQNHIGTGILLSSGSRTFLKKDSWEEFYYQNSLEFGYIRFKDEFYTGTYKYLSFFNPEVGYKWQVSKELSIDPSMGCLWKIEWRGTEDVDNNSFSSLVPRVGIKIGYSF
jgi:hypothetical protein